MKIEDARRKIGLLGHVTRERGASDFEAQTATHLAQVLMERYGIGREDVRPVASHRNRLTSVYWEQLLKDFGITLNQFGGRASASLGNGMLVVILLAAGVWHVQQASPEGWKVIVRDHGLESLRAYLNKNGPRIYSLVS